MKFKSSFFIFVLFAMTFTLFSFQVFAAGAVEYNCLGRDSASGDSVIFELAFTDYAPEAGYTNQSIAITKKGSQTLTSPVVLQMFGANNKNNCTKNQSNEIYLSKDFDMILPSAGEIADYIVTFKSNCSEARYDVRAYCLLH